MRHVWMGLLSLAVGLSAGCTPAVIARPIATLAGLLGIHALPFDWGTGVF